MITYIETEKKKKENEEVRSHAEYALIGCEKNVKNFLQSFKWMQKKLEYFQWVDYKVPKT